MEMSYGSELFLIYLEASSDCMLTYVGAHFKNCSNMSPDWINFDLSSVGGKT